LEFHPKNSEEVDKIKKGRPEGLPCNGEMRRYGYFLIFLLPTLARAVCLSRLPGVERGERGANTAEK
jgi:hypothetical protein